MKTYDKEDLIACELEIEQLQKKVKSEAYDALNRADKKRLKELLRQKMIIIDSIIG